MPTSEHEKEALRDLLAACGKIAPLARARAKVTAPASPKLAKLWREVAAFVESAAEAERRHGEAS